MVAKVLLCSCIQHMFCGLIECYHKVVMLLWMVALTLVVCYYAIVYKLCGLMCCHAVARVL